MENEIIYVNIGEKTTVCCIITAGGVESSATFCSRLKDKDNMEMRQARAYERALKNLNYFMEKSM